jgi:hypothetical protein
MADQLLDFDRRPVADFLSIFQPTTYNPAYSVGKTGACGERSSDWSTD